jgi:acyl-CoA hydrolase
MPAHTNQAGNIFRGWIMASMDAAAAMATTRLTEAQTVTVAVSNMAFIQAVMCRWLAGHVTMGKARHGTISIPELLAGSSA